MHIIIKIIINHQLENNKNTASLMVIKKFNFIYHNYIEAVQCLN